MQNPLLSAIGHILDHDIIYAAIILALLLIAERSNDRRAKIAVSLAIAFALGLAVKYAVAEPRPCAGAVWCPQDYAFPSTHAAIAFALMFGFMNRKPFPFFLVFALFVSFTRLNIGVHSFIDVLGAVPIALAAYYAADFAWARLGRENWLNRLGLAKKSGDGHTHE